MTAPVASAAGAQLGRETAPRAGLRELHRTGRLAAEYPLVRRLLADLPWTERRWAGQLLTRLDPDDVLREHPAVPTVTVALTGHGTLSALVPALTVELARHGILLRCRVADFDSYVFELSDPGSELYASAADLVLCVLDQMVVFDEVPVPWQPQDVARVAAEKLRLVEHLVQRFETVGHGTLVLNTMPLTRYFAGQLVDLRARARLGAVWREVNTGVLRLAEDHPAVVALDLDPIIADGVAACDARQSVYARAHLSPELLSHYAREVGHLARHLTGQASKCLAVDLDDTIWGGVLGEDGMDGIEVAESYRGEAFRAFQQVVKQIGAQGVLLAAVSKNDPEPVHLALREHPRMTLRDTDFAVVTANWRPKQESLAELAKTLNVGVDSIVFVDDSAYECGLVRHTLPDVTVVCLDDEPALHVEKLLRDGWFNVRALTAEDGARKALYRLEADRRSFLDNFASIEDYLRELGVTVRLGAAGERDAERISQLTLRTNQFNLTTRRLSPAGIHDLICDPAALVLTVYAMDRFGDNGMVGAIIARHDGDLLLIDNFVLSCRVFSRGIEQACLAAVLRHARASGAAAVIGAYRRTAKNGKVADFYERHGFTRVADDTTTAAADDTTTAAKDTTATYRHELAEILAPPGHVTLTATISEDAR